MAPSQRHWRWLVVAAAVASASCTAVAASPPLSLTVLPQPFAESHGAACLDGSPPAFYSLVQDPTKWVLFIEGGGWCFDQTPEGVVSNCAGRATGGGGSSKYEGPTTNIGGVLSSDPTVNPHFHNWSLVFIHYCDGTSFTSNATDPVPVPAAVQAQLGATAPSSLYFRGRANLVAITSYLTTNLGLNDSVTDIVLSGGSAGATSTYVVLDTFAAWFPKARVTGAPDAGFFLDAFNIGYNTTWYSNCFRAADPLWNSSASGSLNAACLASFGPADAWKCFLQQYAAVFIATPYIILNSAYDMWQITTDLSLGCVPSVNGAPVAGLPSCSASQLAIFQQYRDKQLAAIAPALQVPHTGAFVDSCFVHEQNVDYCSGQSLPNCLGWNVYNVSVPEVGQVTMDDTYYAWFTSVNANYAAVLSARKAFISDVVLPAVSRGEDPNVAVLQHSQRGHNPAIATVWDPAAATVQVIDSVAYPGNPSCPFPAPHVSVGPLVAAE